MRARTWRVALRRAMRRFVRVANQRVPAVDRGLAAWSISLIAARRREKTPVIEVFELRSMAPTGLATVVFPVHPMNRVSPDGRHAIG